MTGVPNCSLSHGLGGGRRLFEHVIMPGTQNPNSWTYNFDEVSGHSLESSQTWGIRIQCLHYKPVSRHFCSAGRGVKSVNRGDCEKQGGKLLRLLSQLRPRIRPQAFVCVSARGVYLFSRTGPGNKFRGGGGGAEEHCFFVLLPFCDTSQKGRAKTVRIITTFVLTFRSVKSSPCSCGSCKSRTRPVRFKKLAIPSCTPGLCTK
jgi:hypothetical protein